MQEDIVIGIVTSVLWVLIGYLTTLIIRFFKDIRPIKKLWLINNHRDLIIVASTSTRTDTGKYLRPSTGIGQLRALGYSVESLSKVYDIKIQNILLSDDQVQRQIEKDIIVLGGPKNNVITRLFLKKVFEKSQIVFQDQNIISWHKGNNVEKFVGKQKNNQVVKDYGLIIRIPNPFTSSNKNASVCIFTGCHTYGTIAAAKYFTNYYLKSFGFRSKPKSNVYLLVECDVLDGFPVGINLIRSHEF